jgi:hypothetical protein
MPLLWKFVCNHAFGSLVWIIERGRLKAELQTLL